MLGAGTSSLRVRELMRAVASTLGIDELRAQVTYTDIVATTARGGVFRTQVAEIANPGVNAHRIAMLQALTRELPRRSSIEDVEAKLAAVEATKPLYPTWLLIILVALACASVTVLTNGGVREVAAVLPASALGFWLNRTLTRHFINHLATVMASAATASAVFVLATRVIDLATGEPGMRTAAGFACASIFLIPGFPLVTGGLDLTRIDLEAGVPRVAYAGMVLLAITIGVWLVAALTGLSPDPVPGLQGPAVIVWGALVLASFFAVFGWATMFNSPFEVALASGVVAVLGNVPRLLLLRHGVSAHVATFGSCFVIGLGCAAIGRMFGMEKIIMTVPTVLVSIPGSSALRTLLYFDRSDLLLALQSGIATVLVVIAMVAGLSGARMLTDPEWAFTRPDAPPLRLVPKTALRGWGRRPDREGAPD